MKMYLTFLTLFFAVNSFSQNISGNVVNEDGKPLEFVSVTIKRESTASFSTITDKDGSFNFKNIKFGNELTLSFSLIGHKVKDTTIVIKEPSFLSVVLPASINELTEVSITKRNRIIERKTDGLVFNVEGNVNTIGSDGLDLLAKTPLVKVDGISISILGRDGVGVMIDNRPTHLSGEALAVFLKSMSADNVSMIEVITNPPSHYDVQGNGGLINIITKKIRTPGYYGTFLGRFSKATYMNLGEGLNLNYNLNKLLLFGSANFSRGAGGPTNSLSRYYGSQTWNQTTAIKEKSKFFNGTFGFEYLLSKNTDIGFSINSSFSSPDNIANSKTIIYNTQRNVVDSILNVKLLGDKSFNSSTANFHVTHRLDTLGKNIVFDADYFSNSSLLSNNSLNLSRLPNGTPTSTPLTEILSINNQESDGYTFNTAIKMPFKNFAFDFGAKASFVKSISDVSLSGLTSESSAGTENANNFRFQENIQAIYGSFNVNTGKWGFQGGLRVEATQTKGISELAIEPNKLTYINVFPTFYATYELDKKNKLAFNFGRRIGRPSFTSFNPYRLYQSQYSYSTGNPNLEPSFTNSFELSNNHGDFLTTTIAYSTSDDMQTYLLVLREGSNIEEYIQGNFLSSRDLVIDNTVSLNPFKWLQSSMEFAFYYNLTTSSSELTQQKVDGTGAELRSSNSLSFEKIKNFNSGLDFRYQFPYTSGINKNREYYSIDLTGSYMFLKKKLQITMAVRDILKTRTVSSFRVSNNIHVRATANNDSRRFLINLKYSFGNTKLLKGQSHNVSGSEQGRSSGN